MSDMRQLSDFEQVFSLASEYCRERISDVAHTLWIKDLKPVGFEDNTMFLRIETSFRRGVIEQKYGALLQEAYSHVMGFDVEVDISSNEEMGLNPSDTQDAEGNGNELEYTFDTFIVGSSNKFAHAASIAVAFNPAKDYNPLFIYGESGLGKTHLLNAICTELGKGRENFRQILVHGEAFTNELIDAIKYQTTAEFHAKYRNVDVLMVDDVQFIAGKERTQEEFFHTFNALHNDNKQIILTSDRPPKEIKTLDDRLRNRFEWGLLADIQPPDVETRIAIIRRKAEQLEINVPTEVAEFIASKLKTNIRQLEGVVKKLKAYLLLQGQPPSINNAGNAIRDVLSDNQPVPVTIERILSEVGRTYGVSPTDIRSNKRNSTISTARQVSAYVVKEITQIPYSEIGLEFGGRDHSTIVYSMQKVEDKMNTDPRYKEMVEDIIRNIRSSS